MIAAIAAADTEATPNAESTCNLWGGPDDEVTLFNYQCSFTSLTLTVTATGNDSDSSLTGAAIVHNVASQLELLSQTTRRHRKCLADC